MLIGRSSAWVTDDSTVPLGRRRAGGEDGELMQAIRVNQFGGPEVMKIEDVPDPSPGPGQVVDRGRFGPLRAPRRGRRRGERRRRGPARVAGPARRPAARPASRLGLRTRDGGVPARSRDGQPFLVVLHRRQRSGAEGRGDSVRPARAREKRAAAVGLGSASSSWPSTRSCRRSLPSTSSASSSSRR